MVTAKSFKFKTFAARRIPDPIFKQFNTEKHIFLVNVNDLPHDIPDDANARTPNIKKHIYREIEKSLLDRQEYGGEWIGSFHLKNKGIVVIAESVKEINRNTYEVYIGPRQGIVDGGHTYALIVQHIDEGDLPKNQYVFIEVRTGIFDEWVPYIASGLNTAVQVQDMSIQELEGRFTSIQKALTPKNKEEIAWSENASGSYDAKDIVALMHMLNIALYPNDRPDYPVESYSGKSGVLKKFKDDAGSFERMGKIINDILILHDTISFESPKIWNKNGGKAGNRGAAASLAWTESRQKKQKPFYFPFIQKTSTVRLTNGALYPILGAFRAFVEYDAMDRSSMVWKVPFDQVIQEWRNNAMEMLRATADLCNELGRNPGSLGKSKSNWGNMYNIVSKNIAKI